MAEVKSRTTPCSTSPLHVESLACSPEDATAYQSMVSALHYLTFTRSDISFDVSRVSSLCMLLIWFNLLLEADFALSSEYFDYESKFLIWFFTPYDLLRLRTGLVVLLTIVLLLVLLYFWVLILFCGWLRSKLLYLEVLRRLNIRYWQQLLLSCLGLFSC